MPTKNEFVSHPLIVFLIKITADANILASLLDL
jgi:hypothetical protein